MKLSFSIPDINPATLFNKASDLVELDYWGYRFIDLPILFKWARLPKRPRILQIGCGSGKTSCYIAKSKNCKEFMGIDIDHQAIAKAENKANNLTNVIFQVADATKLPFDSETFDAVIDFDVLHHIPDWHKAIKEAHRVLKPKGKLLIRDYSIETFALPGVGLIYRQLINHPYDHMFDQIEFHTFLRKNGFEITHQNDSNWMMLLVAEKTKKKKLKK